jgi:hypothetical protein
MEPTDDGKRWGWVDEGIWRELPKLPMMLAGLGPPPFDVTLPNGTVRNVVHEPSTGLIEDRPSGA